MRILRVSAGFDPRHGGPAHSTLLSVLAARGVGIDVEVATIDEGSASMSAIQRLREGGVLVQVFPLSRVPAAHRLTISRKLAGWIWVNASRFDVIHIHGAWTASSLAGLVSGRLRGVPIVLTPHESMTEHDVAASGTAGRRIVKRMLRAFYFHILAAVIFASEMERRDSNPRGRARQVVVSHPVELPLEESAGSKANGAVRLGFLGRFDPKKNLDLLLRALPEDAELIVAGDGSEEQRQALHTAARDSGISDRVRWLGFVEGDRKADFFQGIELLVMPSRYECFGMVAAEALAAGVPVVITPRMGIAGLVDKYDCGYIVQPREERLREVLSTREGLEAKAARARSAVEAELSLERHATALAGIYRGAAEERR